MSRIKGGRPSAAIVVAVLALVAAVAGTALAGPDATTSVSKNKTKKIAKKTAKKEDKKQDKRNFPIDSSQIAAGAVGSGQVADNSLTGSDIDEASLGKVPDADTVDGLDSSALGITGEGNLDATSQETILTVPAIGLEVRTDGDADDDLEVRLHNTGTTSIGSQVPGAGNVSVIPAGSNESATAPGTYGATYVDGGGDPDTYDGEERLDAVVFKGPLRVWVECLFPINDVLCRATVYR